MPLGDNLPEEPLPLSREIMRAVHRAARHDGPLPRRERMRLTAALQRSTLQFWYGIREDPRHFEIPTLRAVTALHRAQEALGRSFTAEDITLAVDEDDEYPTFDVLLCGASVGWCSLPTWEQLAPTAWRLSPDCPLLVFSDDIPDGPDLRPEAQEHFGLSICERPAWPQLEPYQQLSLMLGDPQIARLRELVADEMLGRVRRRLAAGGDRELCVGFHAALPVDVTPPIRWPRRLRRRKVNDPDGYHAERWWDRARRDAGLPC